MYDWIESMFQFQRGRRREGEKEAKEQQQVSDSVTRKSNLSCKFADVGVCSGGIAPIVRAAQRPGRAG